ncbi:MAG: hypothetical protein AAFR21_15605 [Pseudomonadota bacterium]
MSKAKETVTVICERHTRLMRRLDEDRVTGALADQLIADIEALNWKIARARARNISEARQKAKLLAELSGVVDPSTIEGALLVSLIDDLTELSRGF